MSDYIAQAARRMYPNMAPAPASIEATEAPAPASAPATPATPTEAADGPPEGPDNSFEAIATRRYGDSTVWSGLVNLDEAPPADAAGYSLDTPLDLRDMSEAGKTAEANVRNAFLSVGCPPSLATELWKDAVGAQRGAFRPQSAASAEAELRAKWGGNYDAKMVSVKAVVRQASAVSPELWTFLERTQLCNSAKFVQKIAAFAGRRPRGV